MSQATKEKSTIIELRKSQPFTPEQEAFLYEYVFKSVEERIHKDLDLPQSEDEKTIVRLFRQLNWAQRKQIILYAKELT